MTAKMKQWIALGTVGMLAVLAAGWFLLVSPKRGEAAGIRDDVASQQTTNSALQTQLAMLKAQAKTLPEQQASLARVAAKIPDNPALPALIRALSKAADDTGVELVSLAPGTPGPVAATAPAAATPSARTPVAAGAAAPAASPFSPGVLTAIPLSINVVGGYFQVEQFFDRLENLARATKVTGFTMAPGTNPVKPAAGQDAATGKTLAAAVNANVYMAVGRGIAPAVTAPVK
jgi:type IV pilus assembly protein PilO